MAVLKYSTGYRGTVQWAAFGTGFKNERQMKFLSIKEASSKISLYQELYKRQWEGFDLLRKRQHVNILLKPLYGLEQTPRFWRPHFHGFLKMIGFPNTGAYPSLYAMMDEEALVNTLLGSFEYFNYQKRHERDSRWHQIQVWNKEGTAAAEIFEDGSQRQRKRYIFYNFSAAWKYLAHFKLKTCRSFNIPPATTFDL